MKLKRFASLALLLSLAIALIGQTGPRINQTFTIAAGTPINVASGTTTTASNAPVYAARVFIQMLSGCSSCGQGYVMDGINYPRVPSHSNSTDLTATLAPATSTAPGGSYSDNSLGNNGQLIDVNRLWIDGSHTGDTVVVSYFKAQAQ
jgi:hypothetical protein